MLKNPPRMAENNLFSMFAIFTLLSALSVILTANAVHSVFFLILVFCNAAGLLTLLGLDFFGVIFLVVYVGAVAVLFLFVVMMLNVKIKEMNETLLRYLPIGALVGFIFLFEVFMMLGVEFTPLFTNPLLVIGNPYLLWLQWESLFLFYSGPYVFGAVLSKPWASSEILGGWFNQHTKLNNFLIKVFNTPQTPNNTTIPEYINWPDTVGGLTVIDTLGQVVYTYYVYFFLASGLILLIAMIGAIKLTLHRLLPSKKQEAFEQNARDSAKTVKRITK